MGFNFRKSFNLGKGFKTTVSKSGVGYSWGTKGFRVTKTAKGDVRNTFSIPGTGISYTQNVKTKKGSLKIIPVILAIIVVAVIFLINNPNIINDALEKFGLKNSITTENPSSSNTSADDIFVYVTASGEKYHLETCRSLKSTKTKISLNNAISQKYEPCSICNPPTK